MTFSLGLENEGQKGLLKSHSHTEKKTSLNEIQFQDDAFQI